MWNFRCPGGSGTEQPSSDAMPARDVLPVSHSSLFLWRATPFPFLAEKRKWGCIRGPMSTREGQAASVTLLRREQLRSASAPTFSIVGFPTSIRRKSRARLWSIEGVRGNHPKGFPGLFFLLPGVFFLEKQKENAVCFPFSRKEKEKNGFKNAFNHSLPRFKKSPFSSLARAIPAPVHQPE